MTSMAYILLQGTALILLNNPSNAADYRLTDVNCGYRSYRGRVMDSLIVGGEEVIPHSWPWLARIVIDGSICGGTIVKKRWVVTAAHCISTLDVNAYTVTVGLHKLSDSSNRGEELKVEKIFKHSGFDGTSSNHDLALLYLKQDATFGRNVMPACIGKTAPDVGKRCIVMGFGRTDKVQSITADVLQEVALPIISKTQCSQWSSERITDNMLCAAYPEGGKDACSGDSGGPLMCRTGTIWNLQGVVSSGPRECGKPGTAGIYTKIVNYRGWIEEQMRSVEKKSNP